MAKPAKNHPWRKTSSNKIYTWAKTQSDVSKVHEFSIGTLTPRQKVKHDKFSQI